MATPTVQQVLDDPDFHALPSEEKQKVLQSISPEQGSDIAQVQAPTTQQISATAPAAGALPTLDETMQRVLARTSQAGQFPAPTQAGNVLTGILSQLVPAPLQPALRPVVSRLGAPLQETAESFAEGALSSMSGGLSEAAARRAGAELEGAGSPRFRSPFAFTAGETLGAVAPIGRVVGPAKSLLGTIGRSGLTGGIFGVAGGVAEEIDQEKDPTVRGALIRGATNAAFAAPAAALIPAIPIGATKAGGVLFSALKNVKNLAFPSARNLLKQAVRFPVSTGAPKRVNDILDRSNEAILKYDLPVENQETYLKAIQEAKKSEYGQFKGALGEAAKTGLTIDVTEDLNKAAKKIIKENPTLEREAGGQKFKDEVEALRDAYSGPIPVEDAENIIQVFNARLESVMKERNIVPKSLKAFPELRAQDDFRKILRNGLVEKLNEFKGKDLQELRSNYGALSELEEAVVKRMIVDGRQLPLNLTQGMALFQGFGSGLAQAAEGRPLAALGTMVGQPVVAGLARKFQEPDELIRKAFEKMRLSKEGNAFTKAIRKFRGGASGAPPASGGPVPPVIPTSPVNAALEQTLGPNS